MLASCAATQHPLLERSTHVRPTVCNVARLLPEFVLTTNPLRPVNFTLRLVSDDEAFVQVCGVWFHLWNNGGEMGLDMINAAQLPVFVPTNLPGLGPNAATVAWWIAQLIKGWALGHACDVEVDFDERLPDDCNEWFK